MFRATSKLRRLLPCACIAATLAHPADFEDPAALEAAARAAALRELPPLAGGQRLQVGPLQPRLQLSHCDTPVKADRAPGVQIPGRLLVELRCEGRAPWHLYVPARVVGTTAVVLTAHALVAGAVLTAKDLTVEQHDLTGLPQGYFDDPAVPVGLTVNRAVAGGAVLTNQQLLGQQAVQHGQTVTLVADAGGFSVRMEGRALSDGMINQRVKVMNLSSGKVVEGIARSPQVVEIIF